MRRAPAPKTQASSAGVALILVMLTIVVLSVLAASIVFSARSEAYASYNYRISTQADYTAKAGLQKALNFFNSNKYKAVDPSAAQTTYNLSQYASSPVALYNTTQRPVQCIANCTSNNQAVILQMNSSGTFNGNYPTNVTNADGQTIPTAFASRFYNISLDPLSSAVNSGQFTVTATLDEIYTVNDAFYPTINRKPYEVWHVVSTATWNSNVGAGSAKPTSVQEATLAPVYLPYFANALYGMCNITMNGNVCTDSYRSTNGSYNGSAPQNCVSGGGVNTNAYASGAGVGAGGNVTLNGGAYVVNGDVSYGATAPSYSSTWSCPSVSSGVTGSVSGVKGTVQPVPAIPEPPMPTFPSCSWYGGSGACSSALPSLPSPTNLGNGDYAWARQISGVWYYTVYTSGHSGGTVNYSMTGTGTSTDPFRLPSISIGNNANVCFTGGTDASSAVYYDIQNVSQSGTGKMYIVNGANPPTACPPQAGYSSPGYAILNIYQTLTMGGQGVVQYGAPPASLVINVYNSGNNSGTSVTMNGNANLTAVVTALGGATLGGGGSGGAFYGAMIAGSITDGGTYSVHYDQSLQIASGKLMPMAIRNYNRPKF
jgi:Tfp pilus assembly protein PilX